MFDAVSKLYELLWRHTTGRPYTEIIRGSYFRHPLPWIITTLILGSFLGHLFW